MSAGRRVPRWRRRRTWLIAALAILLVVLAFVAYSYSETYRVEVKEYTFASADVPEALVGTRIVLLTDIHRSFYYSQARIGGIVDRVDELAPDLIVLGGDYVYGSKEYEASAFAELGRLRAPLGVFAVLGNHDYAHPGGGVNDPAPALAAIAGAGITTLDNSGVWIGKSGGRLWLAGLSDLQQGFPRPVRALQGTAPSDLVLLVSHSPDVAESLQPGGPDLVLSGHTHGGQVTFFGLFAQVPSAYGERYRTGMVWNGKTTVIVSNGVGSIFPPLRFFARPQIVVITLQAAA